MADSVFISYCHKDERWRDDLLTHLKPYLRKGSFSAWSDQQIAPGSRWFREIQAAIAAAKIAVLLVTPDFLASDFIHEHELGPFLREAERGGIRIIWVPVSPCAYEQTPLKDYQAVVNPARPLASIRSKADRNKAWGRVCKEIDKAVRDQSRKSLPATAEQKTQDDVPSGSPRVDTNAKNKGRHRSRQVRVVRRMTMWFSLALIILIAVLLFTSAFFNYPKPITSLFGARGASSPPSQQEGEGSEDTRLSVWWKLEPLDPKTVSPDRPLMHTIDAAEIRRAAALGKIPASELELLEGVVPELAARGPLGELKMAINHIGASLLDVHQQAYASKQPGARVTLDFLRMTASKRLEELCKNVDAFAQILRHSACVDLLVPPTGQTKEQYIMHLLRLANDASAVGRRYVMWESGKAVNGTGYAPANAFLTKDECKIENILAEDCRVRRALWDELQYLKQLEKIVLTRASAEEKQLQGKETRKSPAPPM